MSDLLGRELQIKFKQGLEAKINADATKNQAVEGEPHYCTDSKDLYIFDGTENIFIGGDTPDSKYVVLDPDSSTRNTMTGDLTFPDTGYIMKDANGIKWRVTVSTNGALTITVVATTPIGSPWLFLFGNI